MNFQQPDLSLDLFLCTAWNLFILKGQNASNGTQSAQFSPAARFKQQKFSPAARFRQGEKLKRTLPYCFAPRSLPHSNNGITPAKRNWGIPLRHTQCSKWSESARKNMTASMEVVNKLVATPFLVEKLSQYGLVFLTNGWEKTG